MSGLQSGSVRARSVNRSRVASGKLGRAPKGGVRQSVRFTHQDVYDHLNGNWQQMGFDSFSAAVDFALALAFGKWRELGFGTEKEGREYLAAFARREVIRPPRLRLGQEALPLATDCAA